METMIVTLLALYDSIMDLITSGQWTQMNGDVTPNVKVKE